MMAQGTDHQVNIHQSPENIYGLIDSGFATRRLPNPKKSNKCLIYFLTLIVILSILVLIFAFAILRIQTPQVYLNSVSIPNLSKSIPSKPSLNGTLVAVIGIYNKNFGYFKYEKSSIAFLYQNVTLGVVNVTGGLVFVRRTERVNAMVEVRSNYLLNKNQNFTRDVDSDLLELRSLATLVGRVHVAGIFKLRTRKLMNCSMTLNLPSKAIQDLTCL